MKKIIRNITTLSIAVIGLFSSCNLDEIQYSTVPNADAFQSKELCIANLNGCYAPMNSIYTYTYLIVTEGVTDLMHIKSGTLDAQLDISPAQPRFGQTMWTQGYLGVMRSNSAFEGIDKLSPLSEEEKMPLLAEAVILRAYYYWFLTCTFGDVPFYTEHIGDLETLDRISLLGRTPAKEIRDYLIKELLDYVPLLPQKRTSDDPENRLGAAMGWMLIAKMAQWNKQWDVAKDAIEKLEKIYGDLSQYKLEDIMLKNKNIPESIFEVQFTYSATGIRKTTNAAAICMPTHGKGYLYDGVEIPELDSLSTTWTALRPNNYYFQSLMPQRGNDKRKELNMAWEYNGQKFNSTTTAPWLGPKFWSFGMANTADGNNQKVFRYADAILMQAENYMELQNAEESIRYLNMVRRRAGIADYAFRNWDALREEIQKERGRELLGEYQRKYDLVRWGIWYQMTYDYTDYSTVETRILPCHEYYPIPDKEVIYSKYNLDNEAYAKYGL